MSRVNELALGYPEGRIELQLIGGFRDQQGYAEDLFSNIMRKSQSFSFHRSLSPSEHGGDLMPLIDCREINRWM